MKNILSTTILNLYKELNKEYAESSFGYGAMSIIGQSCLGSASVMLILMNKDLYTPFKLSEVFLVIIFCMAFNASVLSQQKNKYQVNILILSVIISLVFIVLNLF